MLTFLQHANAGIQISKVDFRGQHTQKSKRCGRGIEKVRISVWSPPPQISARYGESWDEEEEEDDDDDDDDDDEEEWRLLVNHQLQTDLALLRI